jgi:nitroreductase
MEFRVVIERRRSIRHYSAEPVAPDVLDRILREVSRAPSAGNLQAYRIAVVETAKKRHALAVAAESQEFIEEAPVALVFFADPDRSVTRYGERGATLYSVQDATIAATFALLAATDEGLGSVWVGAFDEAAVRSICGMEAQRPVAIVLIGHSAEAPAASPRRAIGQTIVKVRP